jgi:Xaa-Pro aminopeptidase
MRLERLGDRLAGLGVDALLVSDLTNVRYLTGYSGSNGAVVARPDGAAFLTDFRYLERVEPLREFIDVRQANQDLFSFIAARWHELAPGAARIGFEASHVSVSRHAVLADAAGAVELVATSGAVEGLRLIKDGEEVELISRASATLEPVYGALVEDGFAGRTEFDVAWRIHELVREQGGDEIAFSPIVASGPAGALPHAEPRRVAIEPGSLVTIDLGAKLEGYCSDCTRTFAVGRPPTELDEVYQLVLRAQLAGLDAVRPGVTGVDADALVRRTISEAGHGDHFQHGTGHGVGLDIHEDPRLSTTSTATLEPGMIVTVEPGVYLPGVGGVRIEDLVVVTDDGCEPLTGYPKQLITAA